MNNKKSPGPAAFIFPLPDYLKDEYLKWSDSFQQKQSENKDQGFTPVFIPVYPGYPGSVPYPFNPGVNYPAGGGAPFWASGINPFVIFLIFILLIIGFKKDAIINAIRDFILKTK